jgi:hypothetical protein
MTNEDFMKQFVDLINSYASKPRTNEDFIELMSNTFAAAIGCLITTGNYDPKILLLIKRIFIDKLDKLQEIIEDK